MLLEDTRTTLINKSRNVGDYKDRSRGKNRFERKRYSKIANQVKSYSSIDMNKFFKQDILQFDVPVTGETDSYTVTVKMEGVCAEIAKNIKNNKYKLEFRTIIQALTKIFNTANIYIKCTCPDHTFNYAHWNIVNNVSVDDTAQDPGPGKGIRNPRDEKGRGCKHILLVLSNQDFLMKVASCIKNYIFYLDENMHDTFLKVIFPKLYGITVDEAADYNLVPEDVDLTSDKHTIETINTWAQNRGKIQKGSNKNPATGKGTITANKPEENNEA